MCYDGMGRWRHFCCNGFVSWKMPLKLLNSWEIPRNTGWVLFMFVCWIPKNSKNDWRFRWDFLLVHDSGPNLGTVHVTRHILKRQGVWWFDGCQEFGFSMFQQTFSHRNSCWLLPPCSSPQTPVRYDDAIFHLAEARSLYVRGLPDLDIWRVRYHTN